jgi:hypothetical protein
MNKVEYQREEQAGDVGELDAAAIAGQLDPFPFPLPAAPISGLYTWQQPIFPLPLTPLPLEPIPTALPGPSSSPFSSLAAESATEAWAQAQAEAEAEAAVPILSLSREELRLDLDGYYTQRTASGTVLRGIGSRVNWIAKLVPSGTNRWTGSIWYKEGDVASFPFTTVRIQVVRSFIPSNRSATVTFSGGGANRVRAFRFTSRYFHPANFEFDCAEGEEATLSINTGDHPNRPGGLPLENLTIQKVYQRAGLDVSTSPGGPVAIAGAGANALWSDDEMHDAMQTFWSHFANAPQWAMWVFFASLHEMGTSLGGIMFDDIGPNHRQGTAIFNDAFIANAPAGDPNPAAWVRRMIFWTACHEMGHGFNLAHSWQKQHPPAWGTSWIPLANEPEARSFMNYPYNVTGGQAAFFKDFEFRFSDGELLFMRHAPERFVQMGNASWFDNHGFQGAIVLPEPTFKLELRVNRETPSFEYLEPVTLELKLSNNSSQPQLVDEHLLSTSDTLTVIIKRQNRPAQRYVPYAKYCFLPTKKLLKPAESIYESLFVSAGINGWDIAEPGNYMVQVALQVNGEDIISNPLHARVTPPRSYKEEIIAQDFFTEEVGRIIAFDGSRYFQGGNDTLREVVDKLSDRRVALHASLALGNVLASDYKQLVADAEAPGKGLRIEVHPAQPEEAADLLSKALTDQPQVAAETLGHIDLKLYVDRASQKLAEQGATDTAARLQETLYETLSERTVHGRKVLDSVLQEIRERRDTYAVQKSGAAAAGRDGRSGEHGIAAAAKPR